MGRLYTNGRTLLSYKAFVCMLIAGCSKKIISRVEQYLDTSLIANRTRIQVLKFCE
jgi:hypothetical protein